jgi:putative transposase
VILDVYWRYVVGWMVAAREAAALAERLLAQTIAAQRVEADTLTVHADRGTSMTSKPVAMLLSDLGMTKSHSRPHVPDDNPYSESQFKTLKHHPTFPDRFGCIRTPQLLPVVLRLVQLRAPPQRDRAAPPADVHYGRAEQIITARAVVLEGAYAAHPERFVRNPPQPPALPEAVWINRPVDPTEASQQFPHDLSHRG